MSPRSPRGFVPIAKSKNATERLIHIALARSSLVAHGSLCLAEETKSDAGSGRVSHSALSMSAEGDPALEGRRRRSPLALGEAVARTAEADRGSSRGGQRSSRVPSYRARRIRRGASGPRMVEDNRGARLRKIGRAHV